MRLREREMPLDPEIERELDAIDRALAGRPVDPQLEDLALLAAEIRTERPEPSAEAEARLDRLAAEGFPPRASDRLGRASRRTSDVFAALRRKGARRLIPVFSAAAVFAIAAGRGDLRERDLRGGKYGAPPQTAEPASTGTDRPSTRATSSSRSSTCPPRGQSRGADTTASARRPSRHPGPTSPRAAAVPGRGGASRQQARNVDLELATAPGDFRDAADGVLDVVRDRHAFVLSSHVSGGDPSVEGAERGRASFDLRIPAGQLSAAMGDLSDLGHVVSRTDGTHDITKRFVSDRKRIDDLTAERDTLLRQLGEATDDRRATEHPGSSAHRRESARDRPQGPCHGAAACPSGPRRGDDRRRRERSLGRSVVDRGRLPRCGRRRAPGQTGRDHRGAVRRDSQVERSRSAPSTLGSQPNTWELSTNAWRCPGPRRARRRRRRGSPRCGRQLEDVAASWRCAVQQQQRRGPGLPTAGPSARRHRRRRRR